MKQIIKGDDLMLFDSQGHSIGWATSHSLTLSAESVSTSTKDHGIYSGIEVNKISWEITSENLYSTEEYTALFDAMMNRKSIVVYFGLKTAGGTNTVANDDFGAWSMANTANLAKPSSGNHTAVYTETGTSLKGPHGFTGKAFITSLSVNANTGEAATFSLTLTGDGKLEKVASA